MILKIDVVHSLGGGNKCVAKRRAQRQRTSFILRELKNQHDAVLSGWLPLGSSVLRRTWPDSYLYYMVGFGFV